MAKHGKKEKCERTLTLIAANWNNASLARLTLKRTMNGVVSTIWVGRRMIRVSGNMRMRGNLLMLLLKRPAILLCLLSVGGDEVTTAANADGRVWET